MVTTVKYKDFLDIGYKPSSKDLLCLFRVTPAKGFTMKEAVSRVASESSNGTWSDLTVPSHIRSLSAKVYQIKGDLAWIAYPNELFEPGNMPNVVSSVMGNIFGMKALKGLRLEDVRWPHNIIKSFRGPQFGVKGIRKLLGVKKRPITATVPKPKTGYYPSEHAQVGYDVWTGGIDLLKDDENLSSQRFNPFDKRLAASMKALRKAERKTGDKKGYLCNVSAETSEMIKRARKVARTGNKFVMVDLLTVGWAGVQTLREETEKLGLAIHAHRAFHSTFDRNPYHGVSMKVVVEMARIIGTDTIHIGGLGKLVGDRDYVKDNYVKCISRANESSKGVLAQSWDHTKPLMGCCSGGLHPGIVSRLIKLLSPDIMLQAGGGVLGHREGAHAGAQALTQVLNGLMNGQSLKEIAREHEVVAIALDQWGTKTPK